MLDGEGLSAWVAQDRNVLGLLKVFHDVGADLIISATFPREHAAAPVDAVPGQGEPVTEQTAEEAARLLETAGLHGHKCAVDATVAGAALRQAGPVVLWEVDHMARLCGKQVGLIGL